jgi:hypothetical protein
MSVEKFQDRDDDYLNWVTAHRAGYVINVSRGERGVAMMHSAACHTIVSRPPFTGPYIKICSTALAELHQWASDHRRADLKYCGTCQPPGYIARSQQAAPADPASPPLAFASAPAHTMAADEWEIDGPDDGKRGVRLWSNSYIPFERLTKDQRDAREELKRRVRSLIAGADEILHASYAGVKPPNMDVENLVLYNIDATSGGCFQPSTAHGVRFEMAPALHGNLPSGRPYACSYQYRLTSPDSSLSYWQPIRRLASFAEADLGPFPSIKRLEQVWLAIHHAQAETAGQPFVPTERFAVFLTLSHPGTKSAGANPELVKAIIDGTVAAFQAHSDRASAAEIVDRLAVITRKRVDLIKQVLLDDRHAVLGTDRLVHLRGTGVQWNPADHLCVAGQVVCRQAPGTRWMLSGEIHAVEQVRQARCGS